MGSAIPGTIPLGALGAYLVYLWTAQRSNALNKNPIVIPSHESPDLSQEPLKEIEKAVHDSVPVVMRFLSASWNLFMAALQAIGVMPMFRRIPWLFAVVIFLLLGIIPPVGIFFFAIGCVAISKGAKVENNFIISLNNKDEF